MQILTESQSLCEILNSVSWVPFRDEPQSNKEPNSGFEKSLTSLFQQVLDSYISVLSSISSHILHQIFYSVIVPCLTDTSLDFGLEQEYPAELKIFGVKIAEKIITICQGDLIMSKSFMDSLVRQS